MCVCVASIPAYGVATTVVAGVVVAAVVDAEVLGFERENDDVVVLRCDIKHTVT